ncbi:hypothetical protein ACFL0V_03190 [Nanoarchaeota archaeon]
MPLERTLAEFGNPMQVEPQVVNGVSITKPFTAYVEQMGDEETTYYVARLLHKTDKGITTVVMRSASTPEAAAQKLVKRMATQYLDLQHSVRLFPDRESVKEELELISQYVGNSS